MNYPAWQLKKGDPAAEKALAGAGCGVLLRRVLAARGCADPTAAQALLGEGTPREAAITLFGSFAATGHGHGTDRALIAGLLGFQPDDERIARSFDIARDAGMAFSFTLSRAGGEHPNTARIDLVGQSGKTLSMTGSSLGGGRIMVVEMNGLRANFSGDLPTLIVQNVDQPGHVSEVTSMLAHKGVNIATMQLYRDHPGGNAVMIIETDKAVPPEGIAWLERSEGITRVTFIDAEREA